MADENLEGLEGLDDFGDDFGDQLDSFMEGDEDEGDSELDLFFEDLSTIDDLEMKEDGGSEPEATPEEAPAEDAEPEAAEAEAAGDQAGVAKAGAQIVGEVAGAVVPVADIANIATDVGSTYKELRKAGVTHQQMAGAAVELAGKAIKEPGKVVKAVGETVADIPEQTAAGFSYLGEKFRNMRSKLSLSGYSPF